MSSQRDYLSRDFFAEPRRNYPFVRRCVKGPKGARVRLWGVYYRAENGLEECVATFLDRQTAKECAQRLRIN